MLGQGWPRQRKVCRNIVGHGRDNFCIDKRLWVAIELDVHRPTRATTRTTSAQRVRQTQRAQQAPSARGSAHVTGPEDFSVMTGLLSSKKRNKMTPEIWEVILFFIYKIRKRVSLDSCIRQKSKKYRNNRKKKGKKYMNSPKI